MTNHNGAPPITDDVPKLRVVRVHINDWVASTRGMSLDEEGFFWRFTCLFYDRMGDIADDDNHNARAMNLDVRRYKHMKALLVKAGKISIVDGKLTNARAEREIASYVAEYKRRSEAAKERESKRRVADERPKIGADFDPTSPRHRPDIGTEVDPKSSVLRSDTDADLSEKDNENNGCDATTVAERDHSPRARARPKPKPKPVEEESKYPHTPPKGGSDPLDQAFEDFWSAFPGGRKRGKGEARDAFRKIVTGRHRRGLRAKAETIIAAAAAYAATSPDPEYAPMPSTWLNGGRWEDDIAVAASADPAPVDGKKWGWWRGVEGKLRDLPIERWRDAITKAKPNGTWPWWILAAPPGHAECLVPMELQAPFIEIYRGNITHV